MATPFVSTAMFPISRDIPVGAVIFYGNRQDVETYFLTDDCKVKKEILDRHAVKYVLSPVLIPCNYDLIYSGDRNYIYEIK
jgi:hypothetical protein